MKKWLLTDNEKSIFDVLIYRILVTLSIPSTSWFRLPQKITVSYSLIYKINEDRYWIIKTYNNNEISAVPSKNVLGKSIYILEKMVERYSSMVKDVCQIEIYDIRSDDPAAFNVLKKISFVHRDSGPPPPPPDTKKFNTIFL